MKYHYFFTRFSSLYFIYFVCIVCNCRILMTLLGQRWINPKGEKNNIHTRNIFFVSPDFLRNNIKKSLLSLLCLAKKVWIVRDIKFPLQTELRSIGWLMKIRLPQQGRSQNLISFLQRRTYTFVHGNENHPKIFNI